MRVTRAYQCLCDEFKICAAINKEKAQTANPNFLIILHATAGYFCRLLVWCVADKGGDM
jgi:hypothetical protein